MSARFLTKLYNTRQRHFEYPITRVGVLGVPFEKGVPNPGSAEAAKLLRSYKLIDGLRSIHDRMDVVDYGDFEYKETKEPPTVPNPNNQPLRQNYNHVIALCKHLSDRCKAIREDGRKLLMIGGDHSMSIGTVHGHIRSLKGVTDIALLCVDAFPNLKTSPTSHTSSLSCMPVAFLTKELEDTWPLMPELDWYEPLLTIRNVAYIGLRAVDVNERLIIDKFRVPAYGINEIERFGIETVIDMALNHLDPFANRSLHISFAMAALDKLEAPCTLTATKLYNSSLRGGLTLRECLHIFERVFMTGRLGGVDLMEFNPSYGDNKDVATTAEAALLLCRAAFGEQRKGVIPAVTRLAAFRPNFEATKQKVRKVMVEENPQVPSPVEIVKKPPAFSGENKDTGPNNEGSPSQTPK